MNETITEPETGWKFLDLTDGNIMSRHSANRAGAWVIGEWKHQDGRIQTCARGFHCSPGIGEAMYYVAGAVLAKVEAKGSKASESTDDMPKAAYSDMRIIEAYHWTIQDAIELAVFSAELVLPIWRQHEADDVTVPNAIEAAKRYLADPDSITDAELVRASDAAWAAYTDGDARYDYAAAAAARAVMAAVEVKRGREASAYEVAQGAGTAASHIILNHPEDREDYSFAPVVEAWLVEKVKTLKPVE